MAALDDPARSAELERRGLPALDEGVDPASAAHGGHRAQDPYPDRRRRRGPRGPLPPPAVVGGGLRGRRRRARGEEVAVRRDDFVDGFDTYTEKPGHSWPADIAFADVQPTTRPSRPRRARAGAPPQRPRCRADRQALLRVRRPGGRPVPRPADPRRRRVLGGRRSAAYPALAVDVEAAGATFVDGAAVDDDNLVTGRAWPDHPQWFRSFMTQLRKAAPVGWPVCGHPVGVATSMASSCQRNGPVAAGVRMTSQARPTRSASPPRW